VEFLPIQGMLQLPGHLPGQQMEGLALAPVHLLSNS
jgi:hypothetical protein